MVEAPTIHELQQVNGWLEEYANFGPNDDETADIVAMIQKMDKWLAELGKVEHDPAAVISLAVETAEKVGPFEGVMALSTAHIEKTTADGLAQDTLSLTLFEHGEHGWLIYVNSDGEWNGDDFPEELIGCLKYAHARNCCWLLLDGDASEVPGLPTFHW